MKVKCHHCGYEWNTSSKMAQVGCPSCGNKIKLKTPEELKEAREGGSE